MLKTLSFLAAATMFAGAAAAQPVTVYGSSVPTARVSFADLDIGSAEGVAVLKGRVRLAAGGLCLSRDHEPLNISLERQHCFHTAVNGGFAQINRLLAQQLAGNAVFTTALLITPH